MHCHNGAALSDCRVRRKWLAGLARKQDYALFFAKKRVFGRCFTVVGTGLHLQQLSAAASKKTHNKTVSAAHADE